MHPIKSTISGRKNWDSELNHPETSDAFQLSLPTCDSDIIFEEFNTDTESAGEIT